MIVKKAKWEICKCCNKQSRLSDDIYGCDGCRKPIDFNEKGIDYLDASVFMHGDKSKTLHFCSWKCCIEILRKTQTDYFISLPYLSFDSTKEGMRASDFFELLRPDT